MFCLWPDAYTIGNQLVLQSVDVEISQNDIIFYRQRRGSAGSLTCGSTTNHHADSLNSIIITRCATSGNAKIFDTIGENHTVRQLEVSIIF